MDFSTLPVVDRFQARDGTMLGYRHYPARGTPVGRIAILVHGSSGSSRSAIQALSQALAARGVENYAVDIRGHGESGTRGDIRYFGQLEDDLADIVAEIRKVHPAEALTLIGHSAGGGFALRVAASPIQNLFARTVLLAPYLGYDAPSNRPDAGGWASADIPAHSSRCRCCAARHRLLRVAADAGLRGAAEFGEDPGADLFDRLMRNFANRGLSHRSRRRDQADHDLLPAPPTN